MKHKLLLLYAWGIRTLLFFFPDIPLFMRFRGFCYGLGMSKCGKNFQVTHDVIIKDLQGIRIGDNVFIGNGTVAMGSGTIVIEDEVLIAPHCILISGNHVFENGSFRSKKSDTGKIHIGLGSWVAGNCTIARNSCLPAFSILSANSFLNRTFKEERTLYGGVPARIIKKLDI